MGHKKKKCKSVKENLPATIKYKWRFLLYKNCYGSSRSKNISPNAASSSVVIFFKNLLHGRQSVIGGPFGGSRFALQCRPQGLQMLVGQLTAQMMHAAVAPMKAAGWPIK